MKLGRTLRPPASASVDFTALGENSLDTVVVVSGQPQAGKQAASALIELPGGQAATAAVAMARLRWRSRYAGVVGDDRAAAVVADALESERVGTALTTRAGAQTRRAVVVVDGASGDRRVIEHRDPSLDLGRDEPPEVAFTDTRVLLVDLTDPVAALRAARAAHGAGVRIVIDVDRPNPALADLLALVDLVVVPEAALLSMAGTAEVGRAIRRLAMDSGGAAVIATLGPNGAVAWCGGQEIRSPAHPVTAIDTTGAGDAFRAGLAAGWLGRWPADPDLEDLLADGNLVGGLNCRAVGAQTSLPQAFEVPGHLRGPV